MKKVTMQDIADQVGVTRMTVSKCFQNSDDISAEMKEKIMSVAAKLGYVYNKQMRYRVLVLVSEVFLSKTEDFYNSLFKRLNELSGLNNMMLSLVVAKRNEEEEYIFDGDFQNSDAIIVLGQLPYETIMELKKYNLPTICVDFYYRNSGIDTISCNNFQASYNLTSYLIEKRHKEIGFVGNLNATNSINDRYLGYYKALMEQRLFINDEYRIDDRNEKGEIIDLLLPKNLPTAFVCNNDHIAYLLVRQLKKLGYQVPKDISVVGFDDVIYSSISEPSITTMRVTRKYMAEQAIKLLLRRIQNPTAEIRNITVDCNLIERESVAKGMN
ncbi:MAG: LacI family DNA-binding transcriptional regulator [Herbinix sp.]|nr:LacI family DNA-binding transcriptional regulator [Herbinix sp.]